jgi:BirA family transcriptional regulator, biotin operon repressor / biotin---[acetyl-CoA-carboxylase] ligase
MSLREVLVELAKSDSVSGEALAQRLGVTRAAVWKQIERLRDAGVDVAAVPGSGYRLARSIELLDAAAIRRALPAPARALLSRVEVAFEIDSTSNELLRRANDDAGSGTVLFAERQSGGRGRRGRAWHSPLGANLYFSVLWRFDGGLAALAGLSLAVGVSIARVLRDLGAPAVALKWPNDLVCAGRKLGGILVEAGGEANGACHAVIGIGLNVRMAPVDKAIIDQPWCDLGAAFDGESPGRNALAGALVGALLPDLAAFAVDGGAAARHVFAQYDALAGAEIDVHAGNRTWRGTAQGVDTLGRLLVDDARGERHALSSAEISVRRPTVPA